MKIRNGFVSNSSSSSFVLSPKHLTTFEVAKMMMNIRNEDWVDDDIDSTDNPHYLKGKNNINRAIKLGVDENFPITFQTTNYDTFIIKSEDQILIETCNNHNYWNTLSRYTERINSANSLKVGDDGDGFRVSRLDYFWDCEQDFLGKDINYELEGSNYCTQHTMQHLFETKNGIYVCPSCCRENNPGMLDEIERDIKRKTLPPIKPTTLRIRG